MVSTRSTSSSVRSSSRLYNRNGVEGNKKGKGNSGQGIGGDGAREPTGSLRRRSGRLNKNAGGGGGESSNGSVDDYVKVKGNVRGPNDDDDDDGDNDGGASALKTNGYDEVGKPAGKGTLIGESRSDWRAFSADQALQFCCCLFYANRGDKTAKKTRRNNNAGFLIVIIISYVAFPSSMSPPMEPGHVFYYGWITALSTGLGVLPLVFVPHMDRYWVGFSNAIAAGMMIAASASLLYEAINVEVPEMEEYGEMVRGWRSVCGVIMGGLFIQMTKKFLEEHEHLKVAGFQGVEAKKVLLIGKMESA